MLLTNKVSDLYSYMVSDLYSYYTITNKGTNPYIRLICNILCVAELRGFDIFGAMEEKIEYNKTRADHSREARAKAGGKKV